MLVQKKDHRKKNTEQKEELNKVKIDLKKNKEKVHTNILQKWLSIEFTKTIHRRELAKH